MNFAAIKAGAIKLLSLCKKILTVTGPLAVVRDVLSIGSLVIVQEIDNRARKSFDLLFDGIRMIFLSSLSIDVVYASVDSCSNF